MTRFWWLLPLTFVLVSCDDPEENAFRVNRWFGFVIAAAVLLVLIAVVRRVTR